MGKISSYALFAILSAGALGHMQMTNPLPVRSPEDPDATNPDYDYVSPLDASGSDFPCKGYHTDPFRATAEYQPGQSYTMEIEGGATHEGGSCQLSLSYDQGESFKVIKSMIGGCPLQSSYDFTIPDDAPAGEALFAWSWFNKVGNREMYMNCAHVTIGGSGGPSSRSRHVHRRHLSQRQESSGFSDAPTIFIANVEGPGQCKTIEGQSVDFPYPGDDVENGEPTNGEGFECSGDVPGAPNGDSPAPPAPPTDPEPVPTEPTEPEPTPPAPSTTMVTYPAPTGSSSVPPSPSPTPPTGGQCSGEETVCNSPDTFSVCSNGNLVFMGSVAAGMKCEGGSIVQG